MIICNAYYGLYILQIFWNSNICTTVADSTIWLQFYLNQRAVMYLVLIDPQNPKYDVLLLTKISFAESESRIRAELG